MKIDELIEIVGGILYNEEYDEDIEILGGCGADLMSDVLASIEPGAVLLTGLCNPQVVRTSVMADVAAVVLVRGKKAPPETVNLAIKEEIPLITSPYGMFELCGRLHKAGLPSLEQPVLGEEDQNCDC